MRIVVSNPDHLGDVTLREPLFSALCDAGHDLMVVVRDFVAPLVREIAPYAHIAQCPGDPYAADFRLDTPLGLELRAQVERFAPELLVIAPYQFTGLEQQLAAWLPAVETIGLSGRLFQPVAGVPLPVTIRFDRQVPVSRESAEWEKNQLLCNAILPDAGTLRAPSIALSAGARRLAEGHLRRLGLKPGSYWAVCAADRPPLGVRNWECEKWVEVVRTLIERHNIRVLFIGNQEEHEGTKAIQAGLGGAARRTATITGNAISVNELLGLIGFSEGYLGKDTGPMHFAAALGKPVVAVFAGGTWPRFVPQARAGAVFTIDMPCTSCDYLCHMERPYCVKDVPVAPVLEAAERMILGHDDPFHIELIERDPMIEAETFRDLYQRTKEAIRLQKSERDRFERLLAEKDRELASERMSAEADRVKAAKEVEAKVAEEVTARHREIEEEERRIRRLEIENALLTAASREMRDERASLLTQMECLHAKFAELHSRRGNAAPAPSPAGALPVRMMSGTLGEPPSLAELEQDIQAKSLTIAEIQSQMDTVNSLSRGRTADLEKRLAQLKREKELALCLIPELRDEVATIRREFGSLIAEVRQFANRIGISDRDPAVILQGAANLVLGTRQQINDFTASVSPHLARHVRGGSEEQWSQTACGTGLGQTAALLAEIADAVQRGRKAEEELAGWQNESEVLRRDFANLQSGLAASEDRVEILEQALDEERRACEFARKEADEVRRENGAIAATLRRLAGGDGPGTHWEADVAAIELKLTEGRASSEEVADLSERLRIAAGAKATALGWRADFGVIEEDRFERLSKIDDLGQQVEAQEKVLADRGGQIQRLHEHIQELRSRIESIESRIPVRVLRGLRVL